MNRKRAKEHNRPKAERLSWGVGGRVQGGARDLGEKGEGKINKPKKISFENYQMESSTIYVN